MSEENWQVALAHFHRALRERPSPSAPSNLFGRPCPLPAADWHLRQLDVIGRETATESAAPAQHARRLCHQRMLAHLAEPQQEASRPLVTVLIPVRNRAGLLVEAVRSCLDQSWSPIEILVIDDGSDDDPAAALEEFGARVRLHQKPNGGVASARNLGIRLARGDFIHFLDSDDLLLPDAVARKVAAFSAIPDAALCFSTAIEQNLPGVAVPKIRTPDGTDRCATSDLLAAAVGRCPFFVPTVMMPRWTMLAGPPFEEDLRRGEDSRYWFQFALAGAKAIGFAEPLTVRRVVQDGLSVTRHVGQKVVDIRLRNLRDLLATPSAWRHAGFVLRHLAGKLNDATELSRESVHGIAAFGAVKGTIEHFGDGLPRDGLSPIPLLIDLRNTLDNSTPALDRRWLALWRDLDDAISSALRSAAPLSSRDLAFWGDQAGAGCRNTTIARLFRSLLTLHHDDDRALPIRIGHVLRRGRPTPTADTVKRYRKLRRRLRSGLVAAWLAWPSAYWRPFG